MRAIAEILLCCLCVFSSMYASAQAITRIPLVSSQVESDSSLTYQLGVFSFASQHFNITLNKDGTARDIVSFGKIGFDWLYLLNSNFHFNVYPYTILYERIGDSDIRSYANLLSLEFSYDSRLVLALVGFEYNQSLLNRSPYRSFYFKLRILPNK